MKFKTQFETAWGDTNKHMIIAKTGEWRYNRPVFNLAKCRQCGLCYLYCPTGCINLNKEYFEANLDYCKGCGICASECPAQAIEMIYEEEGE